MVAHYMILAASITSSIAAAAIRCGDNVCSSSEYCSENTFCSSCQDVCEVSSNNYDEHTCKNKCGDYLNNLYVRREDLDAAVSKVYIYATVSLIISILVLLLAVGASLVVWLKYQRVRCYNKSNLKKKMESIKVACANEVDGPKKLKLEMPVSVPDNKDTPPSALTTMTPLSTRTRHPAEDTTLEYVYDNPTLSHSPVFGKNQPQSTPNTTPKTTRTETSF